MIRMNSKAVTLKLNGGDEKTNTSLVLTQNDNLVGVLEFTVLDMLGVEIDYSNVITATMLIKVGSSTYLSPVPCVVNANNIVVNLENEMLSHVGNAACVLKLTGGNGQVYTTTEFYYVIQESLYGDDSEVTSSQASAVDSLIHFISGKPMLSMHDSSCRYENEEYVVRDGVIYQANSDIPIDTSFIEGSGVNEWTAIVSLGGGGVSYETASSIKMKYESNDDTNCYTNLEKSKMDGIEAGAEVNLTASEIKSAYESNFNTNEFTDSEKSKLAGLEDALFLGVYPDEPTLISEHTTGVSGNYAYVDTGIGNPTLLYIWDINDAHWENFGESSEETASSIKTKYESNANTNAYTDTEKTKLENITLTSPINLDNIGDASYPTGGVTGQVLAKASSNDDDVVWADVAPSDGTGIYAVPRERDIDEVDDTERVREIITNGGLIYFKEETYIISSTIRIENSIDVKCHEDAVFYLADNSACRFFDTDKNRTEISGYVKWSGGTFDGNWENQGIDLTDTNHDKSRAFSLYRLDYASVQNVKIGDIEGHAINHWNCNTVEFRNIVFDQAINSQHLSGGSRHDGITGVSRNIIIDNISGFTDDDFVAICPGQDWYGAGTCSVENAYISNLYMGENTSDNTYKTFRGFGIYAVGDYYIKNLYVDGVNGSVHREFGKIMGKVHNATFTNINIEHSPVPVSENINSSNAFLWMYGTQMDKLTVDNVRYTMPNTGFSIPFIKVVNNANIKELCLDNIDATYADATASENVFIKLDIASVVENIYRNRCSINIASDYTVRYFERYIDTSEKSKELIIGSGGQISSTQTITDSDIRTYKFVLKMGEGVANTGGSVRLKTVSMVKQGESTSIISLNDIVSSSSIDVTTDGGEGKILTVNSSGHTYPNISNTMSSITDGTYDILCTYDYISGTEQPMVDIRYAQTGAPDGTIESTTHDTEFNVYAWNGTNYELKSASGGGGITSDEEEYAVTVLNNSFSMWSSSVKRVGDIVYANILLGGKDNAGAYSSGDLIVELSDDIRTGNSIFEFSAVALTTSGRITDYFELYNSGNTYVKTNSTRNNIRWINIAFTYIM